MFEVLKSIGRKVFSGSGATAGGGNDNLEPIGQNSGEGSDDEMKASDVARGGDGESSSHSTTGHGHGQCSLRQVKDSVPEKPGSRKKAGRGENGFEEWGGYMAAKKAKLDAQFNTSSNTSGTGIFAGVSVYINGYTDPPEPQLREMFILHGGTFHTYNSSKTTFVIATNLSAPSKNLYASKTVKPEWITDSIAARNKLDPRKYMLYNLNEEKNQLTLTQLMGNKSPSAIDSIAKKPNSGFDAIPSSKRTLSPAKDIVRNTAQEENNDIIDDPSDFLEASDEESANKLAIRRKSILDKSKKVHELSATPLDSGPSHRKVKMATEDGFLEEFFRNSRLHLISDQKKEMQNKIGHMRKDISRHDYENLRAFSDECGKSVNSTVEENEYCDQAQPVTLMHIDLDCFFVSVGLLKRPHMRGKPVVVTHSTGKEGNSKADIASASYEARRFGISNGMWVSDAKEMCSSLEVIPYDFDEYRRVSELFFDTVAAFTLDIEPCSVDEMVMNATSVLKQVPGSTPEKLAQFLRTKIFEKTQCPASVGIGSNRLLAKLATKKAKPNGIYNLKDEDAQKFIADLPVAELPGIGYSSEAKLTEFFGVTTCKDLLQVPLKDLKMKVGEKTAEKMLQFCLGKDTCDLKYGFDRPKSISVDVNYGIRFTKEDEINDFIMKLCKELSTRASRAQATATNLTLKILSRKKGAGEPKKHGGHGIVDAITRSSRFIQATRDWQEMYRNSTKILKLLALPPIDYRGIGLSLTGLRYDFDKSDLEKRSHQTTLYGIAKSRGQQMIEFAMKAAESKQGCVSNESIKPPLIGQTILDSTSSARSNPSTSTSAHLVQKPKKKIASNGEVPDWLRLPINNKNRDELDIDVLRELPRDIAQESARFYGISDEELDKLLDQGEVALDKGQLSREPTSTSNLNIDRSSATNSGQLLEGKEALKKPLDPYENVDTIDPSFLNALPENVRSEVLLQFQEAKRRKVEIPILPVSNDPQPCSSRQALERDRALNGCNKVAIPQPQIKDRKEKVLGGSNNADSNYTTTGTESGKENEVDVSLVCGENMSEEDELLTPTTPPSSLPDPSSSNSRKRLLTRDNITPIRIRSRKRLDFREETVEKDSSPVTSSCRSSAKGILKSCLSKTKFKDTVYDEEENEGKGKRPIYLERDPIIVPVECVLPALNGSVHVEDVRNQIREGLESVEDPLPEDIEGLRKYFHELVARGCIQQTSILMQFLQRQRKNLPVDSPWPSILQNIIASTDKDIRDIYRLKLGTY